MKPGAALPAGALVALLLAAPSVQAATTERPDEQTRALLMAAIRQSDSFADRFDAEVWMVDMAGRLATRVANPIERLEILRNVHREATAAGLDPQLVLAVIDVESNFDRFAISSAGARGLMQVMPFWLDELDRPDGNLFRIRTNLSFGCAILRIYLDMERDNLTRALARYNGSLGKTWYPERVFKALRTRWFAR